jgi:hypothetical protein
MPEASLSVTLAAAVAVRPVAAERARHRDRRPEQREGAIFL